MKKRLLIGVAKHLSKSSGNLILEAKPGANIGELVVDLKGKKIGYVFDVFGPIENPYVSVKTTIKEPERLIGKQLFVQK